MEYLFFGLAIALVIGFEFVNGFHDTANAVATVIYTNTLKPVYAVVWSGIWNLIGVLTSSGTVAFAIISLLPMELTVNGSSNASSGKGLLMVLALLSSAIIWNLGTWYLGLPVSSTHSSIGAITGIGIANSLFLNTSSQNWWDGVNWSKMQEVLLSLLISPLAGFLGAAILFLLAKALIKQEELYTAPEEKVPSLWVRAVLILTCTGVSFAHGSNDGQKGMGLMMLVLVAVLPNLFSLNMIVSPDVTSGMVIPYWVKITIGLALGLGTMFGWKRVVETVGEKIGNEHLNYAQGAVAELVTMTTIAAADYFGLPVSTTHILSSGIAGSMVANGSGLQMNTLRNLLLAWVLTLPICTLLSFAICAIALFFYAR
ncbi:MAG: inorganic phosphate transporter [Pseudanabaena sp.]|jgi:phosphate/sulfate permease